MDIPSDLVDLQRSYLTAEAAYAAYVREVEARRRAEHPVDVVARHDWADDERAEIARLQAALIAAADAVRTHPAIVAAREDGTRHKLQQAALDAARVSVTA